MGAMERHQLLGAKGGGRGGAGDVPRAVHGPRGVAPALAPLAVPVSRPRHRVQRLSAALADIDDLQPYDGPLGSIEDLARRRIAVVCDADGRTAVVRPDSVIV